MNRDTQKQLLSEAKKLKKFTTLSLARTLGIDLSTSIKLCDQLVSNSDFEKYLRFDCTECGGYLNTYQMGIDEIPIELSCDACGASHNPNDLDEKLFFVKKEGPQQNEGPELIWASKDIMRAMHCPPTREFLEQSQSFIWHISDLHFSATERFYSHGHCDQLKTKFLDLLRQRGRRLINDIIVISGDCTDDGSGDSVERFESFCHEMRALGITSENILVIPGNHDAWNGAWRFKILVQSYFPSLNTEKKLIEKYALYPKRSLPKPFSTFSDNPMRSEIRTINGLKFEFLLINTSIPDEMARGVFPENLKTPDETVDVRVAVMHHHLIENPKHINLDMKHIKNVTAMRVLNHGTALDFLFKARVDLSLHGHKHTHYIRSEQQLRPHEASLILVAAPSLLERNYDVKSGREVPPNYLGFNVLLPSANEMSVFSFRLSDGQYVLMDYHPLKR